MKQLGKNGIIIYPIYLFIIRITSTPLPQNLNCRYSLSLASLLFLNIQIATSISNYRMNGHYSDGGLYIVLLPLGGGHWHHALYIHVPHPYGMLYQPKHATTTTPLIVRDYIIEDMPISRTVTHSYTPSAESHKPHTH